MKRQTTKDCKIVNFNLPVDLLDRLKLAAIGRAYKLGKQVQWTDIVRESLTDLFLTEASKKGELL